jgi:hypothetical protein
MDMPVIHRNTGKITRAGEALAAWLNDQKTPASVREHVATIARNLGSLTSTANFLHFEVPDDESSAAIRAAGVPANTPFQEAEERGLVKGWVTTSLGFRDFDEVAYYDAADALRKYRFRPYIYANPIGGNVGAFSVQMVPEMWNSRGATAEEVNGCGRIVEWPTLAVKKSGPPEEQEVWMVLLLIDVSGAGEVGRLRECQCGKWFYAADLKKLHCSEACCKRKYKPGEEQIKRRQERNRDKQAKTRDENRRRMVQVAAGAQVQYKPSRRYPKMSEWIAEQVNANPPAGQDMITGNWVTRHQAEIEKEVKRLNRAESKRRPRAS